MPLLKTSAIALHSRKWGDADRIVTFYTPAHGKLRGVARGARRMKSKFGGALEPFTYVDLDLFEKRGDSLFRISQVSIRDSFPLLRDDLDRMVGAARLANLVSALAAEGDSMPLLFNTLLDGFRWLQEPGNPSSATLISQIRLLGQTGFRPMADHCAMCGEVPSAAAAAVPSRFSALAGGLICCRCERRAPDRSVPLSPGALAFMRQAQRLAPQIVTRLKASRQVQGQVEAAIEAYVTVVAGRRLPPMDLLSGVPRVTPSALALLPHQDRNESCLPQLAGS